MSEVEFAEDDARLDEVEWEFDHRISREFQPDY